MQHSSNTVSVIGADGMLGRAVVRALEENAKDFNVHEISAGQDIFDYVIAPYVINCAGIVREREHDSGSYSMVKSNALLPHYVANIPTIKRLITVSTDCVFNGLSGPYVEGSQPTPTDLYSRTKLAGEVLDNEKVLTVRTSFIGFGQRGLLRWLLTKPENSIVPGYVDDMWNGLYVGNVAKALVYLCLRKRLHGLLHFVGNPMSKYELLQLLIGRLRQDMVISFITPPAQNHILASSRLDEFDFGQLFETSMRQLYKDYAEWGKDYLCSLETSC